jgi:uncharacterized membrane protein
MAKPGGFGGDMQGDMQDELLGCLMVGRYSLSELALMTGVSKQKIAEELTLLHMVGMIKAYTANGEEAEVPFDSDTTFEA